MFVITEAHTSMTAKLSVSSGTSDRFQEQKTNYPDFDHASSHSFPIKHLCLLTYVQATAFK
jgi:hypothetical protein